MEKAVVPVSLVRSLGPLPGCFCFFFFWVLGLSHPWLYDADNRVANESEGGELLRSCPAKCRCLLLSITGNVEERAIVPISTAKKLANNESAIGEFWVTRIAEWTKRKERAVVPVSEAKLFSTGLRLIFFLKTAWNLWAKRCPTKCKIGERAKWTGRCKDGCGEETNYPNNP